MTHPASIIRGMRKPHLTPLLASVLDEWTQRGWDPTFLASIRMEGEGEGEGEGGTGGSGEGGAGGGGEWKPPASQAELDALVNAQVSARFDAEFGKRKTKWEGDVKSFLEAEAKKSGMEGDAATLVAEAERKAGETVSAANQRVLRTEAKVAAIAAGVKADRAATFLKLVDLADVKVTDDGDVDEKALADAVKKTLDDNPEFKAAGNGQGGQGNGQSGGEFNGNGGGKVWTKAEIAAMSTDEYEKHEPEILKQLATTGVK